MKAKKTFADQVRAVVRNVPKGRVMTYGAVAKAAGHPGAARAVGAVMKENYDLSVPCHRIVRADGAIGEYNRGGPSKKKSILVSEGAFDKYGKLRFS